MTAPRVYTFEERWARAAKLARELRVKLGEAESSDEWLERATEFFYEMARQRDAAADGGRG